MTSEIVFSEDTPLPPPSALSVNVTILYPHKEIDKQLPASVEIDVLLSDLEDEYYDLGGSKPTSRGKWIMRKFHGEAFDPELSLSEVGVHSGDTILFEWVDHLSQFIPITSDPLIAVAEYVNKQFGAVRFSVIAHNMAWIYLFSSYAIAVLGTYGAFHAARNHLWQWLLYEAIGLGITFLSGFFFQDLPNRLSFILWSCVPYPVAAACAGIGSPWGYPHMLVICGAILCATIMIPLITKDAMMIAGIAPGLAIGGIAWALCRLFTHISTLQVGLLMVFLGFVVLLASTRISTLIVPITLPVLPDSRGNIPGLDSDNDQGISLAHTEKTDNLWLRSIMSVHITTGNLIASPVLIDFGLWIAIQPGDPHWWYYAILAGIIFFILILRVEAYQNITIHAVTALLGAFTIAFSTAFHLAILDPHLTMPIAGVLALLGTIGALYGVKGIYISKPVPIVTQVIRGIEWVLVVAGLAYVLYLTGFFEYVYNLDWHIHL